MGQGHATNGIPHADYPAYYRRRAEGEAGLIISGATAIPHPTAPINVYEPHFHGELALQGWKSALAEVHAAGGKMMPQLWHAGLQGLSPEPPEGRQLGPSGIWLPALDAQGQAGTPEPRNEPMSQQEIDLVIDAFGTAVETAQRLDFDGVELHGGHGFLIDQFFWATTNRRTDGYGGDVVARTRFAVEVITECRRRVGPKFPLFMRISQFKMTDYAAQLVSTPEELASFIEPLSAAGIDVFDCSQRRFAQPLFEGSHLNLAGWLKRLSGKPTIAVGGIGLARNAVDFGTPGNYETVAEGSVAQLDLVCEMLARGDFDLICLARAILGDASWPAKVRRGADDELTAFTAAHMMKLT